jgi:hypothetical protein
MLVRLCCIVAYLLYHRYPPVLDAELDSIDAGIAVVKAHALNGDTQDDTQLVPAEKQVYTTCYDILYM